MPDDETPDIPPPAVEDEAQPAARDADETEEPAGLAEAPAQGLAEALEAPLTDSAAEAFHRRARLAEDRLAEVLEAYRKLKQENDAYRERLTKNIERRFEQRRERLLLKFMDILDNLDRALEAAETTYTGEPMIEGLILVRTQLLQTLQEEGLERIPVLGLAYDPNVSEAVETRPVDDPEHHHVVVKELLRGYRLNGRVARASRVVVGQFAGAGPEAGAALTGEPAPVAEGAEPPLPAGREEPTLDDIIARAEAHGEPAAEPSVAAADETQAAGDRTDEDEPSR